ncbi:MAG: O-antigen ligase family protein, partial [Anaerolineales bacterium]
MSKLIGWLKPFTAAWNKPADDQIRGMGSLNDVSPPAESMDWLLVLEWVVLALLAVPLLFLRPAWTPLLLLLPLLWALRWRQSDTPFPVTPLNLSLLLLSVMLLISLWATFSIEFSLGKISGLLFGLAVFFAVVRLPKRWYLHALVLFLIMGLAVAGLGLISTPWPAKITVLGELGARIPQSIKGLPGADLGVHPNELAGVLIIFPMLALGMALKIRGEERGAWLWRVLLGLTALVILAVAIFTQSRSAFIGLAPGLTLLLLGLGRWGRLVLVILIVAGVVVITQVGVEPLLGLSDVQDASPLGEITFASRIEIWSRALYGMQDFSFTGMGMGTFRRVAPILYPFFMISPDKDVAHAHNVFLQTGLDLGVPGLIAYLSLLIGSFAMLVDVIRHTGNEIILNHIKT